MEAFCVWYSIYYVNDLFTARFRIRKYMDMEAGNSGMSAEMRRREIAYEADRAWYPRRERPTLYDGISSLVQLDDSFFSKEHLERAKKPMESDDEGEYKVFLLYHGPEPPYPDDPTSDMEDSPWLREIVEKQRINKARFREEMARFEEMEGSKPGDILGVEETAEKMDELQL